MSSKYEGAITVDFERLLEATPEELDMNALMPGHNLATFQLAEVPDAAASDTAGSPFRNFGPYVGAPCFVKPLGEGEGAATDGGGELLEGTVSGWAHDPGPQWRVTAAGNQASGHVDQVGLHKLFAKHRAAQPKHSQYEWIHVLSEDVREVKSLR